VNANGISATQLTNDAVITAKIKDLNVTGAKIENKTIEYCSKGTYAQTPRIL
jgi:hypothetical protein